MLFGCSIKGNAKVKISSLVGTFINIRIFK
jgi:hypothetical protein